MKPQYIFGESILDTLSHEKLNQNRIEKRILCELDRILGIEIRCCSYCVFKGIQPGIVEILFASDGDGEKLLKAGAKREPSSFDAIIPDEKLNGKIIKTIDVVLRENGINQPANQYVVYARNFYQTVVSRFFEEKIDEIFRFCKDEMRDIDFVLNYNMSCGVPGYYYILFKNNDCLEKYMNNGIVDSLIQKIDGYCTEKVPFSAYKCVKVYPCVESLDNLSDDYMGIVNNNRKNPFNNY